MLTINEIPRQPDKLIRMGHAPVDVPPLAVAPSPSAEIEPPVINELPKQEVEVITMGSKEPDEEIPPPAVLIADVEEKSIKEAATTPPVVKIVHKEKKTAKQSKEGEKVDHA